MNDLLIACNARWDLLWGGIALGLGAFWLLLKTLPDE